MTKSAEYLRIGFFSQEWTKNAALELVIEQNPFNDFLAGTIAAKMQTIIIPKEVAMPLQFGKRHISRM